MISAGTGYSHTLKGPFPPWYKLTAILTKFWNLGAFVPINRCRSGPNSANWSRPFSMGVCFDAKYRSGRLTPSPRMAKNMPAFFHSFIYLHKTNGPYQVGLNQTTKKRTGTRTHINTENRAYRYFNKICNVWRDPCSADQNDIWPATVDPQSLSNQRKFYLDQFILMSVTGDNATRNFEKILKIRGRSILHPPILYRTGQNLAQSGAQSRQSRAKFLLGSCNTWFCYYVNQARSILTILTIFW